MVCDNAAASFVELPDRFTGFFSNRQTAREDKCLEVVSNEFACLQLIDRYPSGLETAIF